MAGRYGPNIITDNLKLYVDAANKESYPQTGTTWTDLSGEGNEGTISGATFTSENSKNSVSGGTITNDGEYIIHTFTNDSTSENFITDVALTADVLIVAGGGGGGLDMGGGGGAGGLIYRQGISISAGTNAIVVGSGGAGAPGPNTGGQSSGHQWTVNASNGENTTAIGYTAIGGGYGGTGPYNHTLAGDPNSGGSGGGGSGYGNDYSTTTLASGTTGQGNDGGIGGIGGDGTANSGAIRYYSGGGGGAGEVGKTSTSSVAPDGGDGLQIDIDGNNYFWAGGGGGSGYSTLHAGDGGAGGGGGAGARGYSYGGSGINDGAGNNTNAGSGQANIGGGDAGANTGGGGGGASHYAAAAGGGDGGSGIVIVRYHRSFAPRRFYFGFDGTDDEVNFGNIILLTSASSTFEAWARPATGISDYDIIINKENTYELAWYGAGANPSGGLITALHNGTTWNWVAGTGANTFNIGEWAHVAVVWNGTTIFTYVNGVQKASASWSGTVYGVSTDLLYIGRRGNNAMWVGDIDQVRIYDKRLMSAEILQNYNAQKGRYGL